MTCISLPFPAKYRQVDNREPEEPETGCTICGRCPHCHTRVCKCQCCAKCPTCRARVCVCWGVFLRLDRINLRERFGDVFQIDHRGDMPCRYGTLSALGHGRLSVYIGDHYRVAGALSRIPGVVNCKKYTVPDDSGECDRTYQFHLAQFDAVAKVVKPLKKHVGRSAAHLVVFRFKHDPSSN